MKLPTLPLRLAFVCVIVALLSSCARHPQDFRLLMPGLEIDQEIATELVEIFGEGSPLSLEIVPLEDLPESFASPLDALEAGYADLAFASNTQPYRPDISTTIPLYPTVLHIMYRRGTDTSDLRSMLHGASIYAGPTGSASRQLMQDVLASLDMKEGDVTYATRADGLPDIAVLYAPVAPERMQSFLRERDAIGVYQLLSFGTPEDIGRGSAIDRALLLKPRWSPFVVPIGTYGEMTPEPIVTVAVDKLLVARSDLPAASVYDLINELLRLQPALAATYPVLFRDLNDDFDASGSTFVLHRGAQAFVQRDEPTIYERYSGIAEVFVTLMIALVSGTYAVVRIYNLRRKNRIDTFYSDAIAIRDAISDDCSINERADASQEVRALQNKAFEMLVSEKLAADESFRIFITLSNDIIADLKD